MQKRLNDDQWREVFELAHAAADLPQHVRAAFIASHSSSPDIAREVTALMDQLDESTPAVGAAGTEIDHFVISEQIGSGGMGDVYSAQDTELGRTVAIKLLKPHSLGLGDVEDRFIREARTASALNHPNIVTIHEFIRAPRGLAIVMELVAGVSLRKLCSEAQPVGRVVKYGEQMAEALAAAHAAGIVHRDVKPENVVLRNDGRIKVLDFGLARNFASLTDGAQSSPALPAGTWRYMSPEQFKGLPVTGSSDVFALGMVLYELLTGRYPFPEGSPFEILQSIATYEVPPPSAWNSETPPVLDAMVTAMLAKDPGQRPDAQAVADTLRKLDMELKAPPLVAVPAERRRWGLAILVGLIAVAAATAWAMLHNRDRWTFEQVTTLVPENRATAAAISRDGKFIAYANGDGVFVRNRETGDTRLLQSPPDFVVDRLSWFTDGLKIVTSGFSAATHAPAIWSLSIKDEPARALLEYAGNGVPSPDGKEIAFISGDLASIWVIPSSGGDARQVLTASTGDTFVTVLWSSTGKHLLFQRRHYSGDRDLGFVVLDRYYERSLESLDLATGQIVAKMPDLWIDSASSLSDGRVVFLRLAKPGNEFENQLWETRVDPANGRFVGPLEKKAEPLRGESGRLVQMSVTSDGSQVLVLRVQPQNAVFVADLYHDPVRFQGARRLTLDAKSSYPHAWTADSRAVIFESDRNGSWDLFQQRIDARVPDLIIATPGRAEVLPQLAPDRKSILYAESPQEKMGNYTLMRVPLSGGAAAQLRPSGSAVDEFRCPLHYDHCIERTTIGRNYFVYSQLDPITGATRELARTVWMPSVIGDWDVSPDGRFVALPNHDWRSAKIRVIDLHPKPSDRRGRELDLVGLSNLNGLIWAAQGTGWFVSVNTTVGRRLLFIDLDGQRTPLGDIQGWVAPSPDGKKVAFLNNIAATNAWLMKSR